MYNLNDYCSVQEYTYYYRDAPHSLSTARRYMAEELTIRKTLSSKSIIYCFTYAKNGLWGERTEVYIIWAIPSLVCQLI